MQAVAKHCYGIVRLAWQADIRAVIIGQRYLSV
jgi:hypothetical protein